MARNTSCPMGSVKSSGWRLVITSPTICGEISMDPSTLDWASR